MIKNGIRTELSRKVCSRAGKIQMDCPDDLDGNKQKVTVNDLINYWRSELNRSMPICWKVSPLQTTSFNR